MSPPTAAGSVELLGMTWDHPRGYDPLVVASERFAAENPGVSIRWEKRSLSGFEERSVEEMARTYDLMIIDHPHVGEIAQTGCLAPFEETPGESRLAQIASGSVGGSFESYFYQGRQWALPIDAAAQVCAWREGFREGTTATWDECLSLATRARVVWPLKPVHAMMSFFTMCANLGAPCATEGETLIAEEHAGPVLEALLALAERVPAACFEMDPIDALEAIGAGEADLSPLTYGYVSYARAGFRPERVRFGDIPALGGRGPAGSTIGGTGVAVSASSEHVGVARDFALALAGPDWQRTLFFDGGGQPAHAEAWDDARTNAETADFFAGTRATLDAGYMRPRFPGYVAFQRRAGTLVAETLRREREIPRAVREINDAFARASAGERV